jgi:hypothetical protein
VSLSSTPRGGFCRFSAPHGNDKVMSIMVRQMRQAFTLAAITLRYSTAAAEQPPVTVISPCECRDNHGTGRWAVKNDPSTPPTDASAIQSVTLSDMSRWPGIDVQLNWQSERTGRENNWYSLTRRVVAVKVEADGDPQIVRPSQSTAETQPRLQPVLLRVSAMISHISRSQNARLYNQIHHCGFSV